MNFIAKPPFRVEPARGQPVLAKRITVDYHVCDAKGRTVAIFPAGKNGAKRARRLARALNGEP